MFESDAQLFFDAETYVLDAVEKFGITQGNIYTIINKMNEIGYENSSFVNIQDKINNVTKKLNDLVENITKVRENLLNIDQTFANEYSGILTDYSIDDVSKFDNSSFVLDDTELDFCELTDLQYNRLSMVSYYFSNQFDKFEANKGKKLSEIESLVSDEQYFTSYGLGDMVIYDVIADDYGNALLLVLVDEMGNYTLVFPCTSNPNDLKATGRNLWQQIEDAVYDGEIYLDVDLLGNVAAEKELVAKYTREYYEKASEEGKKINFLGYSKGGGVAEYAYLSIAKELSDNERQTLGEIIVYNPLHDNLTDEEVTLLKESGDFTVYRIQGDLISTHVHENTFDNETIFIYCNWASETGEVFSVTNDEDRLASWQRAIGAGAGILDPYIGPKLPTTGLDPYFGPGTSLVDSTMLIKNIDYVQYAFMGGTHSLGSYDEYLAFDDYGNSIYNPKSYLYTESGKYTGREVCMYLYGIEDLDEVLTELADFAL